MIDIDWTLFHFIRPDWLWGLPVAIVVWSLFKWAGTTSQWEQFIPREMVNALKVNSTKQSSFWRWLLLGVWLCLILGAAGPAWEKQSVPVVENQRSLVIALDLSPSMLAQDISPNRLTRAKYKLIDIIRAQDDGQIALVAYAGDAHTVNPLSDDPRTIEALLPALHPRIMPSSGSQAEAAVELALKLLKDAGASSGEILLITDGLNVEAINNTKRLFKGNHRLSILGVGSSEAAPIPKVDGGFVRNSDNEIILTEVNRLELADLAASFGGQYADISNDDSDIEKLRLGDLEFFQLQNQDQVTETYDAWADMGHLFAILCLPLMLFLFRRGLIYLLPLAILLPLDSQASDEQSFQWDDLWQTKDQQAAKLYAEGDFTAAANKFDSKEWAAMSAYRAGAYETAIKAYSSTKSARSLYNKGNALALNGKLKEAIESYDQALRLQPDLEDAAYNKKIVEQLSQQDQSQPDSQQQDENSEKDGDQEQSGSDSQDQQSEQSSDQQSESTGESSEDSEPTDSESSDGEEPSAGEEPSDSEEPLAKDENASENEANTNNDTQAEEQEGQTEGALENSDTPLENASEQWLRAIPDDPSGLLRRKFDYQSKKRLQDRSTRSQDDIDTTRY